MDKISKLKDYLGIPRMEISWYPAINQDLCTACGICVSACKHEVYEQNEEKNVTVANPFYCEVGCESCKFQCPVEAISFPNRGELKTTIKSLRIKYPPTD